MKIRRVDLNNVPIYELALLMLVLMNEITTIYVFSNVSILDSMVNFLQLIIYAALIYLVLKQKYTLNNFFLYGLVGVLLLIGYLVSRQAAFFRGFLLILAASKIQYKSILRICRFASSSIIVLAVVLWVIGISNSGVGRRGALAFGFSHPNVAAQMIMLVCLLWVSEMGEKMKYTDYFILEIVAVAILVLTDSRTSTVVVAILPIILILNKKILRNRQFSKAMAYLLAYSQVGVAAFTFITAKFLENSGILRSLNIVLSSRLFLNYYVLNKYGIKLFGQNVVLQDNSGSVYNNIQNSYNWNITCDCSYMVSFIVMGLIPTIIVCIGYIVLMKKAIRNQDYMVVSIALMLAIYAFCESQMIEIYKNFVYFYLIVEEPSKKHGACQTKKR